MPWHILAPAAVACDIYLIRRSAHPRGAFFTLQESNFLQSKKKPWYHQGFFHAGDGTWTHTILLPQAPEACASANSATPANKWYIIKCRGKCQLLFFGRLCQVFVGTFFVFRNSVEKLCVSWFYVPLRSAQVRGSPNLLRHSRLTNA